MKINLVNHGRAYANMIMNTMLDDGVKTMKSYAPRPTGRPEGKGSMSTGALRDTIIKQYNGDDKGFVGTYTDYAKFAEAGRGPITKPHYMKFKGADGRWHRAKHVEGMEGWHFVKYTAAYLRNKYGGK